MAENKRVGVAALLHESNTFAAGVTDLALFREGWLLTGDAVAAELRDAHHEVGGFLAGLTAAGIEPVPLLAARAMPAGPVTSEAMRALIELLLAELDRAQHAAPLDGMLIAPHGATVSELAADADGHWLGIVRQAVGRIPIVATVDCHANLSPRMVDACDAIIAYRRNPHLDQRDRGLEAAALMAATLHEGRRPVMAACLPPVAINIERQLTDGPALQPLYQLADQLRQRPGILSVSIVQGFPYADVSEMGSSVIAVADGDAELAAATARELGAKLWDERQQYVGQLTSPEAVVEQVVAALADGASDGASGKPVCLLDMGDNIGGGSPGDGTVLARLLHERGVAGSFVSLCDPQAQADARAAGLGATVQLAVGAKRDQLHGTPLAAPFTVIGLHDGGFNEPEPRHGGVPRYEMGPTAIVRSDRGLLVQLTSRRVAPASIHQLTSCDIDPATLRAIVAKGVNLPVAAYAPVCDRLIRVDTPGCTTANMTSLDHRRRRRPMFPFEADTVWEPVAHVSRRAAGRATPRGGTDRG